MLVMESEGKGKDKGLQSISECDEWDQHDEYYSLPIISLSSGEKTARTIINRSEDDVRGIASSGEASEADVHQNQGGQATVCVQQQVRGHRRANARQEDKERE